MTLNYNLTLSYLGFFSTPTLIVCGGQLAFAVTITEGTLERDVEVMVSAVDGPLTMQGMTLANAPSVSLYVWQEWILEIFPVMC